MHQEQNQPSLQQTSKYGLLPTPPVPQDLVSIDLTENARQVLLRRRCAAIKMANRPKL